MIESLPKNKHISKDYRDACNSKSNRTEKKEHLPAKEKPKIIMLEKHNSWKIKFKP